VVVEGVGEFSTFAEGAQLHHCGEEVQSFDFLPEVEAAAVPVVGHVFEVCFDDAIGGHFGAVERLEPVLPAIARPE